MGACDSSTTSNPNKELNGNPTPPSGKYFKEKNPLERQNTLVLNNDVIVSDTHQNPEMLYEKIKNRKYIKD